MLTYLHYRESESVIAGSDPELKSSVSTKNFGNLASNEATNTTEEKHVSNASKRQAAVGNS